MGSPPGSCCCSVCGARRASAPPTPPPDFFLDRRCERGVKWRRLVRIFPLRSRLLCREGWMSRSLIKGVVTVTLLAGLTWAGTAVGQTPWVVPEADKAKKNPLPDDKKVI